MNDLQGTKRSRPDDRAEVMDETVALHTLVFNSLDEHIAVINEAGAIVDVNAAWRRFGNANDIAPEFLGAGANYLDVLGAAQCDGDDFATAARNGIVAVIDGTLDSFYYEYPCDAPDEKRWFMMRVTPLKDGTRRFFVVAHHEITQRKLAEEKAELAAMHDPLTGLANRRYFNRFLRREFQRSIRERSSISLIEIDVDHFKHFNDECGHPVGDECLAQVGRVLGGLSQRPTDLAARLGGDEFALILGDTNEAGAREVANSLRKAIGKLDIVSGSSRRLSISVGVASAHPRENDDEELLHKQADRALYEAKAAGRDRVRFWKQVPGDSV